MSPHKTERLSCIIVIAIATALLCAGGLIEWITAIILLVVVLPSFGIIRRKTKAAILHDIEQQARIMADLTESAQQPKPHQAPRSRSV